MAVRREYGAVCWLASGRWQARFPDPTSRTRPSPPLLGGLVAKPRGTQSGGYDALPTRSSRSERRWLTEAIHDSSSP